MLVYRRFLAELIGTALLVVGGVGTAVLAPTSGPIAVALAFGLSLLVLAYAFGPVSGCHINPAVTVGVLIAGKISVRDAAGYIIAQFVGAVGGTRIVYAVATHRSGYHLSTDGIGANGWGSHSSGGYSFVAAAVVEVVLTALLVYTVLSVTRSQSTAAVAGIPIGIALLVCHLVAVPIDGTSVNPARSFGPALFTGSSALSQLWLFIVAPVVGAVLAALLHRVLTPPLEEARAGGTHDDSTAAHADAHG